MIEIFKHRNLSLINQNSTNFVYLYYLEIGQYQKIIHNKTEGIYWIEYSGGIIMDQNHKVYND